MKCYLFVNSNMSFKRRFKNVYENGYIIIYKSQIKLHNRNENIANAAINLKTTRM